MFRVNGYEILWCLTCGLITTSHPKSVWFHENPTRQPGVLRSTQRYRMFLSDGVEQTPYRALALTLCNSVDILILAGANRKALIAKCDMTEQLRELIRYSDLLKQLVVRDLKVRYKNSALGFFWSLLNPIVQVVTITIVIKYVMNLNIPNYSAYLLVAYLPWVFFQMALLDSSQIIIHHRDLLRRVYFPREVLPLSAVVANLIHFALALLVFFAYLVFYIHFFLHGSSLLITSLWLPVLMALQFLLAVGLAFFISCANVFYEDTKYILSVLLNVMFYLTPVMYPAELVYSHLMSLDMPHSTQILLYKLYLLNPINALTEAYRKILLPPVSGLTIRGTAVEALPLDIGMVLVAAVVCIVVAVAGYAYFNSRKWVFPERV